MAHRILVVGGNGFLGSSICKASVARGWSVTSVSQSGKPFRTPNGHSPAWTQQVQWRTGSAQEPSTFADLLGNNRTVVHTLGILFEDSFYKTAIRSGNPFSLLKFAADNFTGASRNPLARDGPSTATSYKAINHDSALSVLSAFLSSPPLRAAPSRNFVYISAEDIFRPFVPKGYIDWKRAAEIDIATECATASGAKVRPLFIRPGLMYHPHLRPLTTPIAIFLSATSSLQRAASRSLPLPTPSKILRTLGSRSSPLSSIADALEIPPMHVDHVAEAICLAIERDDTSRPVGVKEMRELIGWGLAEGPTSEASKGFEA